MFPQRLLPGPHLVSIASGVGSTAILSLMATHQGERKLYLMLYWGTRHASLPDSVRDLLESDAVVGTNIEVIMGERFDLRKVLEKECRFEGDGRSGSGRPRTCWYER